MMSHSEQESPFLAEGLGSAGPLAGAISQDLCATAGVYLNVTSSKGPSISLIYSIGPTLLLFPVES